MSDDGVTMAPCCGGCGAPYVPSGRRRYCSARCRMRAYRARRQGVSPTDAQRPRPRADTIYECPTCESRFIAEQRCPDCNVFCRRIGSGGICPHCAEPVAIADLVDIGR